MRRFALLLLAGAPSLVAAQGFGLYEHGTCTMGRAGVAAANPCPDGSAIFFNPAGLAGLTGTRASLGLTLVEATGGFTEDVTAAQTDLENPPIPVPNVYFAHALSPKVTLGVGAYLPYGLRTRWPTQGFQGRFFGYDTEVRSIYIQPTVAYQIHERVKVGIGLAYITSTLELHQRADLSTVQVPGQAFTFASLGIPTGSDFADAALDADGTGFAVNFGAIIKITDRLSIGGRWLTRKTIDYEGDAVFDQVPTGLVLPPGNPLTGTATPVDLLVASQFGPGGSLSDGPVNTAITLPPQGSIGLAYKLRDNWTVMADYQYVVWGWFNTVIVDFANATTPDLTLTPQSNDTHGVRLGAEYQHSPKVTLRAGYLYHTAASPDGFVTPLLPESDRNEVTIGAGIKASDRLHVDLAYQFVKQNDRRGRVFLDSTVGNTGLYEFAAHLFGAGLSYTF